MQWTNEENAGFTTGMPWLPVNPDYDERNVKSQVKDLGSLLNLYRSLIRLRRQYPALARGRWLPLLNGREGIIAYIRGRGEESLLVILNFSGHSRVAKLQEHIHGSVLLSTHRREGDIVYMHDMKIHPYEATVYLTNWD
jgi:oligo-1,6-glucosidase